MPSAFTYIAAPINDPVLRVAAGRLGRSDANRFVSEADVERIVICLRIDGDRLDAELPARTDHPDGDLTTIGNKDTTKHFCLVRLSAI